MSLIRNSIQYGAAAPAAYAAQGVQVHPDVGAKYAAGVLPDTLRIVQFMLWNAAPGSKGNPLPNSRGIWNGHTFGQLEGAGQTAETTRGINTLIDNSAPNNAALRFNASTTNAINAGMAYAPDAATPGIPSNKWVADLCCIDVSHAANAEVGGYMRDGVQLTSTVTLTGAWDGVLPIKLSANDFYINTQIAGVQSPHEFWCAQYGLWLPTALQLALIMNPDGTFKADAFARFSNGSGSAPKDLLVDGSGPGIGTPLLLHEWRAGDAAASFFVNKGNLGSSPTVIGSSNAAIKQVYRAPLDPGGTPDRPYRTGPWMIDTTALNDTTGTYAGISNYGQRIKAGKTLITILVNMGYDAGAVRNPILTDLHANVYARSGYIAGTFGESMCFTKLADANDETAQFTVWGNAPVLAWTPRLGFADGVPSITIGFFEAATFPVVIDAQSGAKAAATTASGYVAESVTATTNKALMISALGFLSAGFEHGMSPPATMDLGVAVGAGASLNNGSGGGMYVAEEKINAAGATGTRTFACLANGNNAFREFSILLQNG